MEALQNSTYKSPIVILPLFQTLHRVRSNVNKPTLIWVPGHVGIVPNKRADSLAKNGPYALNTYTVGSTQPDLDEHLKEQLLVKFHK